MRISDWSSDVCSSDLCANVVAPMRHGIQVRPDDHALCRAVPALQTDIGIPGKILVYGKSVLATNDLQRVVGFLLALSVGNAGDRSEERRVGKACVSKCRYRWAPYT